MKGYEKLEELLNKAVKRAKILKTNGLSNKAIRKVLRNYNADNCTIEMVMSAL